MGVRECKEGYIPPFTPTLFAEPLLQLRHTEVDERQEDGTMIILQNVLAGTLTRLRIQHNHCAVFKF